MQIFLCLPLEGAITANHSFIINHCLLGDKAFWAGLSIYFLIFYTNFHKKAIIVIKNIQKLNKY